VYGLNKRIGNRSFYDPRAEATFTKPYSEETARIIDEEAGAIIERAYASAREILETHQDKLNALAERLLEREVIFKEDLVDVLGPRKWDKPEPAAAKVEPPASDAVESTESVADATPTLDSERPAEEESPNDESRGAEGSAGSADENAA